MVKRKQSVLKPNFQYRDKQKMGSSIARLGSWHISVSCAGAQGLDRLGYRGWFSSDPI